jgi:hypothetical protein
MSSNTRDIALGVVLGVMLVVAITALGIDWGTQRIQTAGLPLDFPIMFQPK